MNRAYLRHVITSESQAILEKLTTAQHLRPHRPVREALQQTIDELGCCPIAVERAMQWLQLDWDRPLGRLRRTELTQLARSIFRFWRQADPAMAPNSAVAE